MIYIGIVGSKERGEYARIKALILKKKKQYREITIVSGGAKGIDTTTRTVAYELDVPLIEYLPKYDEYRDIYEFNEFGEEILIFKGKGNNIYFERNLEIAKKSDELHAFPLNRRGGTMNTVRYFVELGKKDKLFIYD